MATAALVMAKADLHVLLPAVCLVIGIVLGVALTSLMLTSTIQRAARRARWLATLGSPDGCPHCGYGASHE